MSNARLRPYRTIVPLLLALSARACAPAGDGAPPSAAAVEPEPAATAAEPPAAAPDDDPGEAAPAGEAAPTAPGDPAAAPGPAAATALEEADDPACPSGMALVEGSYCLAPEQRCLEVQEIKGAPPGSDRGHCLRYAEPVTCFEDRRRPMRYCMDRYEWPNRRGEKPQVLTSWQDAREMCASVGKRLCTENEFNFACEGEDMKPYVYGHARDATQCNFDRPYRPRTFVFSPWETCLGDEACRAAFEAIDQRLPAGSLESCRSDDGIYDLIGNVNEWVMRPDERPPRRSGIKGGWWGPVRARCRPTVGFHDEGDYGYEVGFRCCADAG